MQYMLITWVYYFLIILIVLGALTLLFISNVLYAFLDLLFIIISLTGLYFLQGAPLVAVIQLLLHAGAILVILISLLFLKPTINHSTIRKKIGIYKLIGIVFIILSLIVGIGFRFNLFTNTFAWLNNNATVGIVAEIGYQIVGTYGLVFELIGILLLIGVVSVVHIMNKNKSAG